MAIRYNGRYSTDAGTSWTSWFTGVLTLTQVVPPALGAMVLQGQAYDDADTSPPTAWASLDITVAMSTAAVVAEIERSVNGAAFQPVPHANRIAGTRLRVDATDVMSGSTVQLRGRWRDLSDGSAPTAWAVGPLYRVVRPTPSPVVALAALPKLRALTAAEISVLTAARVVPHWRVEKRDADGVWREMTGLAGGEDFVKSLSVTESASDPVARARFTFHREVERADGTTASLAPFMEGSTLNARGSGAYAPFLAAGDEIRVLACGLAVGENPASGDWVGLFHGLLDDPTTAGGRDAGEITVDARDLGRRLQDTIVTTPRTYGAVGGQPRAAVMRQFLADNGLSSVTLAVVGQDIWQMEPREVAPGVTVMEMLTAWALEGTGWRVGYRWTGRTTSQLCLYAPSRVPAGSVATPAITLTPSRYLDLAALRTASDGVRNVIEGVAIERATGETITRTVRDEDSIARHGLRFMRLGFDARSHVDTVTRLDNFLRTALTDVAEPFLDAAGVAVQLLPGLGVDDVVALAPNAVQHDTTQQGAVVQVEHTISRTEQTTTVELWGRPAGAFRAWLDREEVFIVSQPVILTARAEPVGAKAKSVLYRLVARAARGGADIGAAPEVAVIEPAGGIAVLAGPPAGVSAPSGTVVEISQPPAGHSPGRFTLRATLPGAAPVEAVITVPPVGATIEGLASLAWTAFALVPASSTNDVSRYEATLSDPRNAATGQATVTLTRTGALTTVTPVTGFPLVGPLPLTIAFDAPRQAHVGVESLVEAYGTAPGVQGAWQRVAIQALGQDTQTPAFTLTQSMFSNRVDLLPEWRHPRTGAVEQADSFAITEGASFDITATFYPAPAVPGHGSPVVPWVVERAPFGGGSRRFTIIAHKAGFASQTAEVDIQAQERDTLTLPPPAFATSNVTANGFRLTITSTAPLGTTAPTLEYVTVSPAVTALVSNTTSGATRTLVIDVTRPARGGAAGAVVVTASLAGWIAAGATYPVAQRATAGADGNLPPGVGQSDGSGVRQLAKGHWQARRRDGDPVTFPQAFASTPVVIVTGVGGIHYQPSSGAWAPSFNASGAQYVDARALDLTTTGFKAYAKLRQRGAPTARSHALSPTTITTQGSFAEAALGFAPASDDTYRGLYSVTLTANIVAGAGISGDAYARVIIAVDSWDADVPVGGAWTERASRSYTISQHFPDTNAGTVTQSWNGEVLSYALQGVATVDKLRVRISLFETTSGSVSVGSMSAEYTTSSGDNTTTMTPQTGDYVTFDIFAAG